MWNPQHLITLQASKACYRDSFTLFVCVVFIVCNVSFIVCIALSAVFCLSVVCYFCEMCIFVLCLTVVPLPPGKNPFAVQLNNNNNNNFATNIACAGVVHR
jgi:hypothetical protein